MPFTTRSKRTCAMASPTSRTPLARWTRSLVSANGFLSGASWCFRVSRRRGVGSMMAPITARTMPTPRHGRCIPLRRPGWPWYAGSWQSTLEAAARRLGVRLTMQGGTDDESSAYRWKTVSVAGRKFTVVAYWCKFAGGVRFIILKGNPFGLASAVLNYNGSGESLVMIMRCIYGSTCTHFYDDHLALEPSIALGSAQVEYRGLCKLLSVHLDADKHRSMDDDFIYIGCRFELEAFFQAFFLILSPKPGRVGKVVQQIMGYLHLGRLTSAEACSLLGVCLFVAGQLQGRCTRLADSVLIRRQYSDRTCPSIVAWISHCVFYSRPPPPLSRPPSPPIALVVALL